MEKLYTKKEVAEYLQVSLRSVQYYIERGELKILKIGGNVRIKEADLKQFVESWEK